MQGYIFIWSRYFTVQVRLYISLYSSGVSERGITFPEFFIPIVWLKDLTRFAQKNNVSIIGGLRYIRNANRAFNCTTIIQPCDNNDFVNTVALFREKNFYAPEEKDCLYKLGYRISNPERPLYYVIYSNGIRYSLMITRTRLFQSLSVPSSSNTLAGNPY